MAAYGAGYGGKATSRSGYGSAWGSFEPPKKKHHHSLLGKIVHAPLDFEYHLAKDITNAAMGLPTGLITLASHPVRGIEDIGKTTWHDWSPLFKGHPLQFAHQFYAHPLAPLLDVASVVTLGGAGVAKGAALAGGVGKAEMAAAIKAGLAEGKSVAEIHAGFSRATRIAMPKDIELKGPGGVKLYKAQHSNPVIRKRQQASRALGHKLAATMPGWFGPAAKIRDLSKAGEFNRLAAKDRSYAGSAESHVVGQQLTIAAMMNAGKLIGENPRTAYTVMHENARPQLENFSKPGDLKELRTSKRPIKEKPPTGPKWETVPGGQGAVAYVPGGAVRARKVAGKNTHRYEEVYHAPKGWVLLKKDKGVPKSLKLDTPEDYMVAVKDRFGALNTGKSAKKSELYLDEHGRPRLVRAEAITQYEGEAYKASKFVRLLVQKPTQVWKWMVLATRPAYFVNNAVGNLFMFLMTANVHGPRALVDAYRNLYGDARATRQLQGADRAYRKYLKQDTNVMEKWYGKLFDQGVAPELLSSVKVHGKVVRVLQKGMYPVTHLVAEKYLRLAATHGLLRAQPEIRALMSDGMSFEHAVDRMSADTGFRTRIVEGVNDTLGDYHHLRPMEQRIRNFVPFYTWDRAIARHGVKLALNKPVRAAFLTRTGESGVTTTKQYLGDIPDFLKGAVPLELLGFKSHNGRVPILTTQGLNPYATLPDVAKGIMSLTTGGVPANEAAATALGPLPSTAIEFFTGQSLLTGAEIPQKTGGLIPSVAINSVMETPWGRFFDRAIHGQPTPKEGSTPFLYAKDLKQESRSILGLPIKQMSPEAAAKLARAERHEKKGRKKTRNYFTAKAYGADNTF